MVAPAGESTVAKSSSNSILDFGLIDIKEHEMDELVFVKYRLVTCYVFLVFL